MSKRKLDFIVRLLLPTIIMGVAAWYLGSLWNARERDMNLILIQPVVYAMVPCYLAVIVYEIQRYRILEKARVSQERAAEPDGEDESVTPRSMLQASHLHLMFISVIGIFAFVYFGAIPATILLCIAGLVTLGVRSAPVLVLVPIGTTAVLWLAFIYGIGVRMPLF